MLAVAAVLAAVAGVAYSAPYLPRLAYEGFPAPVWPAAGNFAEVRGGAGNTLPVDLRSPVPLDPQLEDLLGDAGAKALLVFERGALRFEYYADGVTADTRFNSYSMVKSLIGVLALKAVAEGKFDDLDQPVGSILQEFEDNSFRDVPLRAFLEMRSGIVFEPGTTKRASGVGAKDLESAFANPFGPLARLHMLGLDAVASGLSGGGEGAPDFSYQNINTAILGAALERVYEFPLEHLLSEKIWMPAGAMSAQWRRYREGAGVSPYCCLYARPRDWVRVAQFIAANGDAKTEFLPDELRRELLGQEIDEAALRDGVYGLHVRHDVLDRDGESLQGRFTYFSGSGGQIVYLMPEKELVVVRFGDKIQLLHSTLYATWRTLHDGI